MFNMLNMQFIFCHMLYKSINLVTKFGKITPKLLNMLLNSVGVAIDILINRYMNADQ
jgi:hypothetical protein